MSKEAKNGQQTGKKIVKFQNNYFHHFSGSTTQKNVTSRFHTMFGSRDFRSFLAKIRICGSKFQPNQTFYS